MFQRESLLSVSNHDKKSHVVKHWVTQILGGVLGAVVGLGGVLLLVSWFGLLFCTTGTIDQRDSHKPHHVNSTTEAKNVERILDRTEAPSGMHLKAKFDREEAVLSEARRTYNLPEEIQWKAVVSEEMLNTLGGRTNWNIRGTIEFEGKLHEITGMVSEKVPLMKSYTTSSLTNETKLIQAWSPGLRLHTLVGEYGLPKETEWFADSDSSNPQSRIRLGEVVCTVRGSDLVGPDGKYVPRDPIARQDYLNHVQDGISSWQEQLGRLTRDTRVVRDDTKGKTLPIAEEIEAPSDVSAITVSGNGNMLAFAVSGIVMVVDLESREQTTLAGHDGSISCLAFSPDHTRLLGSGWITTGPLILEWEIASGRILHRCSKDLTVSDGFQQEVNAGTSDVYTMAIERGGAKAGYSNAGLADAFFAQGEVVSTGYASNGTKLVAKLISKSGACLYGADLNRQNSDIVLHSELNYSDPERHDTSRFQVVDHAKAIAYLTPAAYSSGLDINIAPISQGPTTKHPLIAGTCSAHSSWVSSSKIPPGIVITAGCSSYQEEPDWVIVTDVNNESQRVYHRKGLKKFGTVTLSPDTKFLAVQVGDAIELWNTETATVTHRFSNATKPIFLKNSRLALLHGERKISIVEL